MTSRIHYLAACTSLIALIFLCLAWELKLAPIHVGGSWLVLKCLPLLAPLFGILNGRKYTYQWSSMLILVYLAEGVVRVTDSSVRAQLLAGAEILLSLVFFCSVIGYVRQQRAITG
ncbi:MAG: DUF2069 domain-containing protein [Propionivibrio sp.]